MRRFLYIFFTLLFVSTANSLQASDDLTPLGVGPGRGNFHNDIIYYVVVDRFRNGNRDNDIPIEAFPDRETDTAATRHYNQMQRDLLLPNVFDPTRRFAGLRWGGDLEGVIEKLPYLCELGITKLMISPIFENANGWLYNPKDSYVVQLSPRPNPKLEHADQAKMSTSYHGYFTTRYGEIDPHFRKILDPEDPSRFDIWKELLEAAAACTDPITGEPRPIGVILDVTLNHSSPFFPPLTGRTPDWDRSKPQSTFLLLSSSIELSQISFVGLNCEGSGSSHLSFRFRR